MEHIILQHMSPLNEAGILIMNVGYGNMWILLTSSKYARLIHVCRVEHRVSWMYYCNHKCSIWSKSRTSFRLNACFTQVKKSVWSNTFIYPLNDWSSFSCQIYHLLVTYFKYRYRKVQHPKWYQSLDTICKTKTLSGLYHYWLTSILKSKYLSVYEAILCKILHLKIPLQLYLLNETCTSHWNIEAETKWTTFRRRHFQMHFLEWKCLNLD